jgi:hypothetical protein
MARWLSPDWSVKAEPVPYAKLDDPQTLNLYAYVGNNPLSRTDQTGHDGEGGCCTLAPPPVEPPSATGAPVEIGPGILILGAVAGVQFISQMINPPTVGQSDADEIAERDKLDRENQSSDSRVKLDNGRVLFPTPPTDEKAKPEPQPQAASGGKGRIPKPPNSNEHTRGRQSTSDKHTKPRSGRPDTKDRTNEKWRSFKRSKKDQPAS